MYVTSCKGIDQQRVTSAWGILIGHEWNAIMKAVQNTKREIRDT